MKKLLSLLIILCITFFSTRAATWTRVTSVADITSEGVFIIGYEATANSGVIVPMRTEGTATLTAAGFMYSGTTAGFSDSNTIDMSTVTSTTAYEVFITNNSVVAGAVNILINDSYLGNADTKNNCKFFAEESATTAFTPTLDSIGNFAFTIAANSNYTTLQYNISSPRFAVYGGKQKNLVLYKKANVAVTGINLSQTTVSVAAKTEITLTATIRPAEATDKRISWKSNDSNIATVTNGVVKGVSEGVTTITATTKDGGITATCTVTVTPAPAGKIYVPITNESDLVAGEKILIVSATSNFALGTTQNSNNRNAVEIIKDVDNSICIVDEAVEVITLGGREGAWTLNAGGKYLYAVNNNNYLRSITEANAASYWTISISSSGTTIENNSVMGYFIMKNTNSAIFSCYKNTQTGILIYKEKTSTTELPTIFAPTQNPIFTANGQLHVNANIGSLIEVYNILGQKLISTTAQSDETIISGLKTGQILIVRTNNKVVKIKL